MDSNNRKYYFSDLSASMGPRGRRDSASEVDRILASNNNNVTVCNGEVTCRNYGTVNVVNHDEERDGKWPFIVWLLLTVLCVFWHRTVMRKRICYSCYVKSLTLRRKQNADTSKYSLLMDPTCLEYEYDSNDWLNRNNRTTELPLLIDRDEVGGPCDICNITLWNSKGETKHYTDEDIGVSSWVFRVSKCISILGLLFVMCSVIYDFSYYMEKMWGRQDKLLHFISYNAFLVSISVYPIMSLCSKFRSFYGKQEDVAFLCWATSLNTRFISKRLQLLDLSKKGIPGKLFLAVCLVWPMVNAIYRMVIYVYLVKRELSFHTKFTLVTTGVLLIMWGCFVYILYAMRISFQRLFMLTLAFIKDHEGALDICRNSISHVVLDFNCFRSCTVIYMAIMVPFTVLGVTTNISWQYRVSGSCYGIEHSEVEESINILIWSNIIMFIVLSVIALGGLDLNYIWDHFTYNIVQLQTSDNQSFWQKILSHVRLMGGKESVMSLTLVWSVLGFYMGLQFGDNQDIQYGIDKCHDYNITDAIGIVGYAMYIIEPSGIK